MIVGVGVDVIAIARIERVWRRAGQRFARHILSDAELAQFAGQNNPARWLAKRWAAKEAFAKAVGTGMRAPLKWHAITVGHDAHGQPLLTFSPMVRAWLHRRGVAESHLSITDERELACAFVVIEAGQEPVHVA